MIVMQNNVRPPFKASDAIRIAAELYGLSASRAEELVSELDRNFLLDTASGEQFVLKFINRSFEIDDIDLQQKILKHLDGRVSFCPRLLPPQSGDERPTITGEDGQLYLMRMVTYIPGLPLGEFSPHSDSLLRDLGRKLALLDVALLDFDHQRRRTDFRWNVTNLAAVVERLAVGMPDKRKVIINYFVRLYQERVAPILKDLRHSFIHNDANDYNILVKAADLDQVEIAGVIDFGDVVNSPLVADLAVALAYVMMNKQQPLSAVVPMIRGYYEQLPLEEQELTALFPLVAARLCLSVCMSWYQQRQEPDNSYLTISEQGAWRLLEQLREIHPDFALYTIRDACGLVPCPQALGIASWLAEQEMFPVMGHVLTPAECVRFDLSVDSAELGSLAHIEDLEGFTYRLFRQLNPGQVGIGLYNEPRPIYTADLFRVSESERRTIHIGVDLFAPAGTAVHVPLSGYVHNCQDNAGHQDYGPTIILGHETPQGQKFYTLYGHLSRESLAPLKPGQWIEQGAKLAEIGAADVNGGWPPHLHFQIVLDLLGREGEFPGVVSPRDRAVWLSLCPNPNLILNLPVDIESPRDLDHAAIVNMRKSNLNPALSTAYRRHLKIVRGYMHYLYDEYGQPYLDCVNNVAHVGHSNPRVVYVAQKQIAILNTNTRYLHDGIVEYAQRLVEKLPEPLSVCFFVCSGSEANELALRLARTYTGGTDFIVIDHAYHGNTQALIEISPYKYDGPGGKGQQAHVHKVEMPDPYRGRHQGYDAEVGLHYAGSVKNALAEIEARGRPLAGFMAEAVLACGGQVVLPDGYLQAAYQAVRAAGGLCIADEVQIGFGRMGTHFWGFETQDVVPDIVTLGKPIGNGHPLSAVVTTPEIAAAFHNGMEYFNTFGGNPVSCAIGLEVLRVIEDEGLQENARQVGDYFLECLRSLMVKHALIGQVRGIGLFLGIELVLDRNTLEPAPRQAAYIAERMRDSGILVTTEGPLNNVLKLKPPIIFQRQHVDHFVQTLDEVLSDTVLQLH